MSKTVRALVTPEVLAWARSLDAITQEEASKKMNVKEGKIDEWESGTSMPTLRQAKNLAKYYRVPHEQGDDASTAYFYGIFAGFINDEEMNKILEEIRAKAGQGE